MDSDDVSEHGEQVANVPAGWVGGELVHTGGNLFAREWIHLEEGLRVGYSVDDPTVVGVEDVRFEGSGEKTNPRMWRRVSDIEIESCDGEDDCLETAMNLMRKVGDQE